MESSHQPESPLEGETVRGTVHRLEELSATEVAELARQGAVIILPISPIEEHGPHLPMGTDAMNAAHFAGMSAELIHGLAPDTPIVMAPLIPAGTHVYRFMGSISIRQRVIRNLVIDYGTSLRRAGFSRFLVVSAHGGPGHMVALDEAAATLTLRYRIYTVNLTSTIIYQFLAGTMVERISAACERPLTDEERRVMSMDYHAGWWETAVMLWLRPELVHPSYTELPDALVPRWKLRPRTPLKPPAGLGYLGAPARASVDFAEASLTVLREEAEKIIADFLEGRQKPKRYRSPLYRIPMFRTNFRYWILLVILIALFVIRLATS